MSIILKKLKAFVKWLPKGNDGIGYRIAERPKVYPFRFTSKPAREAHERELDLYLITNMYQ